MKKPLFTMKGFTIIELLISLAIFAFMTAFLVAKYGNFNQGILLTNLAYDVAITLRNAQSYGINVRNRTNLNEDGYIYGFGVHFDSNSNTVDGVIPRQQMIFFADAPIDTGGENLYYNGVYDRLSGEAISIFTIKNGSYISSVCTGDKPENCNSSNSTNGDTVDITFVRPDPNAIITTVDSNGIGSKKTYAEIVLKSSSGLTKKVVVRSTGQITVEN